MLAPEQIYEKTTTGTDIAIRDVDCAFRSQVKFMIFSTINSPSQVLVRRKAKGLLISLSTITCNLESTRSIKELIF